MNGTITIQLDVNKDGHNFSRKAILQLSPQQLAAFLYNGRLCEDINAWQEAKISRENAVKSMVESGL